MIAAFSRAIFGDRVAQAVHVVEVDVGHDGHAAVPGVRRVEPPAQPDLDEREVRPDLGEAGEDDGGQQLELGRLAVARARPGRRRPGRARRAARSRRGDRPAVDLDPLAVGHEVRLGRRPDAIARRPQRASASARTLPLPLVPAISAPRTDRSRIAELAQQRPGPPEAQPDPEAAALGERPQRVVVGEVGRADDRSSVAASLAGQLVLVEDALVEAWGQADVVDVALLHVDAAAQLAARRVRVLADQRLEQVRRLDRDRARGCRSCRSAGRRCGAGSAGRSPARIAGIGGIEPARRPAGRRSRATARRGRSARPRIPDALSNRTAAVRLRGSRACTPLPRLWARATSLVTRATAPEYNAPHRSVRRTPTHGTRVNRRTAAVRQSPAMTTRRDHRQTHVRPRPPSTGRPAPSRSRPRSPGPGRLSGHRPIKRDRGLPMVVRLALVAAVVVLGVGVLYVGVRRARDRRRRDRLDARRLRRRRHLDARRRSASSRSSATRRRSSSRPSRTPPEHRRPRGHRPAGAGRRPDHRIHVYLTLPGPGPDAHPGGAHRRRAEDGHPGRADQGHQRLHGRRSSGRAASPIRRRSSATCSTTRRPRSRSRSPKNNAIVNGKAVDDQGQDAGADHAARPQRRRTGRRSPGRPERTARSRSASRSAPGPTRSPSPATDPAGNATDVDPHRQARRRAS